MKIRFLSNLIRIMCIIFAIWTAIIVLFTYNILDYKESYDLYVGEFINAYIIFLITFILCITFAIILNIRKLMWNEIWKRVIKLIKIFLVLVFLTYAFNYMFRPSQLDLLGIIYNSLGLSVISSFLDLIFFKEGNNK